MRKHIEDALFDYLPADLKPYLAGLGLLAGLGGYLVATNLAAIIPVAVVALMFPLTALSGYPARFNPFKIDLEFRTTAMIVIAAAFGPVYGAFAGVAFTIVNAVASLIHPDDALPEILLYGLCGYLIGLIPFGADNFFALGIALSVAIMALRTTIHKLLGDPLGYCAMQFMGSLVWIVLEMRLVFGYALFKILALHGA